VKTDDLVLMLAAEPEPVRPYAVGRRYALALSLGTIGAFLAMLGLLGLRPDLGDAVRLPMFWVKLGLCAALALFSLQGVLRLSRPGVGLGWVPAGLALPVVGIWLLAGMVLIGAEPAARAELLFGLTWKVCPWLIALLSLPVLVAAFWAMRGLAPTRLPLAGSALGLLAGSLGALVYCLHCPELAAPFLGTWYLIGILIPALIGGLIGARLLRW
jgi:hypothetical protein